MKSKLKERKKKKEKTNPAKPISTDLVLPDIDSEMDGIDDILTEDIDDVLEETEFDRAMDTELERFKEDLEEGGCGCG